MKKIDKLYPGDYRSSRDKSWLGKDRYVSKIKLMGLEDIRTEIRNLKEDMTSNEDKRIYRDMIASRTISANKLSAIIVYLTSLLETF